MNRRDFLKLSASLGIAVMLPAGLLDYEKAVEHRKFTDFDSTREYGRMILFYGGKVPSEFIDKSKEMLMADARECLPAGTVFELRRKVPTHYGMDHGFAWYYSPKLKATPIRTGFDSEIGCFLEGRFTA